MSSFHCVSSTDTTTTKITPTITASILPPSTSRTSNAKTKPRRCQIHKTAIAFRPMWMMSFTVLVVIFHLHLPVASGLTGNEGGFAAKRTPRNGQKFSSINKKVCAPTVNVKLNILLIINQSF